MLDIETLLDIKYYNGSTYTDMKLSLGAPGRDLETVTFAETDYLYIGYYKPIKNIYFDFNSANLTENSLSVEYSNADGSWTALSVFDETLGFTRSGLIQWEEIGQELLGEVSVDSVSKYWVRIQPSVAHDEAIWNFIGLILASDDDLLIENPYILDSNLLMGQSNHLKAHVAARKEIVQTFANKGELKIAGEKRRLTFWDMLDIQEFRQGAIFLALAKIYFNLSDRQDDMWLKKSEEYRKKYMQQIDLYYTSLDYNDNGVTGSSERSAIAKTKTISR